MHPTPDEDCDYGDIAEGYDPSYEGPNYSPEVIAGQGQTPNGDGTVTDTGNRSENVMNVEKKRVNLMLILLINMIDSWRSLLRQRKKPLRRLMTV